MYLLTCMDVTHMASLMIHVFSMHGDPYFSKKFVCLMNIKFRVRVNGEITPRLCNRSAIMLMWKYRTLSLRMSPEIVFQHLHFVSEDS